MAVPYLLVLAPIISIVVLTLGNGLFTTITTLQLDHLQAPVLEIGLISSCYFIGMMLGSIWTQRLIIRIGHIRGFATFASILATCVLIQGLISYPLLWAVLRFFCGYSLAGLFLVIESWLLALGNESNKGQILAFYLLAYYCAQTFSQLLLNLPFNDTLSLFASIAAMVSISVIPVCITHCEAPKPETPKLVSVRYLLSIVPLGVVGCVIAGIVLGIIYTILPLFLQEAHVAASFVAYIMAATVLGGALLQMPVGKLSDWMDRRRVLLMVNVGVTVMCALIFMFHQNTTLLLLWCFLLGGFTFAIYPLCINHTTDYLESGQIVSTLAMLTLLYGIGSALGPVLATAVMKVVGPLGMFAVLGLSSLLLAIYSVWRMFKRAAIADEIKLKYVSTAPESVVIGEQVMEQAESENANGQT